MEEKSTLFQPTRIRLNFKKAFSYLFFNSLITISLLILSSIVNLLFIKVAALYLTRSSFGTLICLVNMMMIIIVPCGAFQIFTSRHITHFLTENEYGKAYHFFIKVVRMSIMGALILALLFFIFKNQLASFFQMSHGEVFQLLGIIIFLLLPFQIYLGFFQGSKSFRSYGCAILTESCARLLLGYAMLSNHGEIVGVVVAFIGSYGAALILCFVIMRKKIMCWKLYPYHSNRDDGASINNFFIILVSLSVYSIIVFSDVLLVKHFFSPELAGDYGAAANIGRFFFFIPLPLITVMYPKIVEQHHQRNEGEIRFVFLNIIFAVALSCVTFIAICYLFSSEIIKIFLDIEKYAHIGFLIHYVSIIMSLLVLSNVVLHYNIARNRFTHFIVIACGVAIQIAAICFYHDSLKMIVQILLLNALFIFLFLMLLTLYQDRKGRFER